MLKILICSHFFLQGNPGCVGQHGHPGYPGCPGPKGTRSLNKDNMITFIFFFYKVVVFVSGDKGESISCPGSPGDRGPQGQDGTPGTDMIIVMQSFKRNDSNLACEWIVLSQVALDLKDILGKTAFSGLQDRRDAKDTLASAESWVTQVNKPIRIHLLLYLKVYYGH